MKLYDNFEATRGTGVLETADSEGKFNFTLYERPHFADDLKRTDFVSRDVFIESQ